MKGIERMERILVADGAEGSGPSPIHYRYPFHPFDLIMVVAEHHTLPSIVSIEPSARCVSSVTFTLRRCVFPPLSDESW